MDGTGDLFAPMLHELGDRWSPMVISYPPDLPMGYAELAGRVAGMLPSDDFVLLGESFSGPVAALVAGMRPTGLRGLILCATFVRNPRPLVRGLSPLTHLLPMSRSWARLSMPWLLGLNVPRPLRELYVRSVGGMPSRIMQSRLRSVLDIDVSGALARIDVPLLYLRATRDRLVPRSAGEWIRCQHPGTHVVDIDAPHGMLQAAPSACAAEIEDFVARLPTL